MARFALLKDLEDYLYLTFTIRRLLLVAMVILSVVPGTIYYGWATSAKWDFVAVYASFLYLTMWTQSRFLIQFAKTAIGTGILGWKYKPTPYSTPEITNLAKRMGVSGKAKVFVTSNPWIGGPFTNALSCAVYLPANWIAAFPKSEVLATVGHEFGHVTRRRRFALEALVAISSVVSFTYLLALHSVPLIYEVAEVSLALLLLSIVSWRGEFRADMEGARFTGPEGLIAVFELLKAETKRDDGSESHPPLHKRIERLAPLLDKPDEATCNKNQGGVISSGLESGP